MKPKYAWGLAILPVGLMFGGSFGLVYPLGVWIAKVLGLDPNAPVLGQDHGALWASVIISLFPVLMVAGYVVGFVLDAVILRLWAGWSTGALRSLFLFSQPPPHWLRNETDARQAETERRDAWASWADTRRMGRAHFILARGTLGWGGLMFVLMSLGPATLGWPYRTDPSVQSLLGQALLWGSAGTIWGLVTWHLSEKAHERASSATVPE